MKPNPNLAPQKQNKKLRGSVAKSIAALTLSVTAATGLFGVTEAGASTHHHSQDNIALKVLTKDIAILDKGGTVDVTTAEVKIPGPIDSASGNPIIFENGKGGTYYAAYRQEHKPNFHLTPEETASTMAIINLGSSYETPLTEAHLDKAGTLVNEDEIPVGYSIGGDSTGK
jgi:hypothetical protein